VEFLLDNWLLILLAASSGAMLLVPSLSGAGGHKVSPSEAVRLINREKGVLIDVSEPAEYAAGHPVGARSIPFGDIEGHKSLPTNKALPIILTCPTGARSGRAAGLLRKQGFEKAVSLAGGNRAWGEATLPVEKAAAQ
jgi:rhodanese-related sulfurtransferase